ncbi:MAG: ribosome small subunit-dependent GTPase A [Kineosporiaceae bacterium]
MVTRRTARLDESDVRVRANPKGNRPRSKDRPKHDDAATAQVVAVDRGRYTCLPGGFDAPADGGLVTAMKARELGRSGVVVGDRVALVGDTSGQPGTLARIVRVEERATMLRRSADDVDPVERPIVANADQLAIVAALADPVPRPRMIDRCLVAAYDAGLGALLVLTKADLLRADAAEPFLAAYREMGVRTVVLGLDDADAGRIDGVEAAVDALDGRVTVLVGHSGVGKSTLVNALVPGAHRATGRVNDVTGRGRHTSTSAIALALPGGGWVIDTPGVRSFGLAHVDPDRLVGHFGDLTPALADCPRGCTHDEPECGLDPYVASGAAGPAGPARLDSLRRLLRSRRGADEDDARAAASAPVSASPDRGHGQG